MPLSRFIIIALLLTSCAAPAMRETADLNSVSPAPAPGATAENKPGASGTVPKIPKHLVVSLPTPTGKDPGWEDMYFENIREREKLSGLQPLKSKAISGDDLEIRVWEGFGITQLTAFVLKRAAGRWSAKELNSEFVKDRRGKGAFRPIDKNFDPPVSGWDAAWQKLTDAGILTLPSSEKTGCGGPAIDGMSYVVEYKLKNTYRTYLYDNPDGRECAEAKQMMKITDIIAEEFYLRKGN